MFSTELQVFIALGVILAAVLIALAVDFLKGSNERLRERNIALAEREKAAVERAGQAERLHGQLVELVETLKEAEKLRPLADLAPMGAPRATEVPAARAEAEAEEEPRLPDAMLVVETPTPVPESPVEVRVVRDESLLMQADEVVEELPPWAGLLVGEQLTGPPVARKTRRYVGSGARGLWEAEVEPEIPRPGLPIEVEERAEVRSAELEDERQDEPVMESQEAVAEDQAGETEADSKVVEMPLPSPARQEAEEDLAVPGGIHRPEVLNELLRSEATFQGVTLSISVVDHLRLVAEHGKEPVEQVMGALEGLVQNSGSRADLVCRISEDEFIVVCPGATGAAARSRVQQLSESLWDFQLRSLVSFPILFSWGASESGLMPGMPRVLADSIDRAREQMLETRRSRRALTWESAKYGLRSNAG